MAGPASGPAHRQTVRDLLNPLHENPRAGTKRVRSRLVAHSVRPKRQTLVWPVRSRLRMNVARIPSSSGTRIRRPGRILVVDDEPHLAEALQTGLSDENEVVVANDATEALARLERGEFYDVVLCELMMPVMDGIDLHRRVSVAHPDMADRIVFMTSEATTARIEAFFCHVPNILLEKPVHLEGLHALIERRLRGAGAAAAC